MFGGVIFCRADRKDILSLTDFVGKRFAAAAPNSLGGWHAAWREFKRLKIQPDKDFSSLIFSGTHDAVVEAVRSGQVDGGTVRSTQLERMAREGRIDLDEFRVFKSPPDSSAGYPFLISTRLYPEWPFAAVKGTDLELGKAVASALLRMGADDPAAKASRGAGWAIPQDYAPVHDCLRELGLAPYENFGRVTFRQAMAQYWGVILAIWAVSSAILILAILSFKTSISLKKSLMAVRVSELKYRSVVENIQDVFYRVDAEGRVELISPSAIRILGYDSVDELIGQSPDIFWADPSKRTALVDELARLGQVSDWEFEAVCRDGTVLQAAATVHLIGDDHKERPLGYEGIWRDISQRKKAEQALRDVVEKTKSIFRAAPIGIGVVVNRCFTEANDRLCDMTGYSREELVGENSRRIYAADEDYEYVGQEKYQQIRDRGIGTVATRWRLKGGAIIDVLLSSAPIDPNDLSGGVTFTVLDITELKRAEEALRDSEEKFRLAFRTSPDSINLNRVSDGTYLDINDGFTKIMNYTREEAIGRSSLELDIWDDPRDRERLVAALRDAGFVENMEASFRRKDGEIRIGLMSARLLRMNREEVILSITRDITERKRAETELLRVHRQNQLILGAAEEAIIGLDLNGKITFANPSAAQTLGYTIGQLIGKDLHQLAHHSKPNGDPYPLSECPMHQSIRFGAKSRVRDEALWRKNGTSFPSVYSSTPITEWGKIIGAVVTFRDITVRRRAEEERGKLQSQLNQAQKLESIGRLAGGVAHDFNNMLGVIIGRAEMALEEDNSTEELQYNLKEILKTSLRSADLTRQLLAFARQQTAVPKTLDLNETISSTLNMLRRLIGEDIDLLWAPGLDLWKVKIDPSQVDQILANLAVNARDAISGVGAITLRTENIAIDEFKRTENPELGALPDFTIT